MKSRYKASATAVELIKAFEGYRADAAQLVDGGWTIGYGHTQTARAGASVSRADADALLTYDLLAVQALVNEAVFTPLDQNQFDALVAFAFNVGADNFRRSTVLRRVNAGDMVQAACAIEMWRKADLDGERLVVDALVRRRAAEKVLFLTPIGGWAPAPSPIVRPRVDYDVGLSLPGSTAELKVSMDGSQVQAHRLVAAEPGRFAESEAGLDLTAPAVPPPEDVDAPALTQPSVDPAIAIADEEAAPIASDASRRIARRASHAPLEDVASATNKQPVDDTALAGVGLGGLALFAGSVFWGVKAKGAGEGLDPMVLASILGLVGIALVAGAVYFLLLRLGGRDD